MKHTCTPEELTTIREAIHAAAAQHHAAEHARGRSAVEEHPEDTNLTAGVAAWMIDIRRERIADDEAALAPRIEHGNGREWTFELMHRIEAAAAGVAYWEGVREAATNRTIRKEN